MPSGFDGFPRRRSRTSRRPASFAVFGVHNWHLALFPPQAQEDVWGTDTSVQVSTGLSPTGIVERVAGGFCLRGRWSFSSGCDYCHWAVVGGVVPPTKIG